MYILNRFLFFLEYAAYSCYFLEVGSIKSNIPDQEVVLFKAITVN